jgi:quercetin dioxygenase-like cupin family protein
MIRSAPHALVTVALLSLAACDEPAKPTQPVARLHADTPSFTVASGLTQTQLGRANAGEIHAHSKFDDFDVELKTHDNTDVSMASSVIVPGGDTGWHGHPGLVIVLIKAGALTFYEADDPTCTPTVHAAGSVVIESSADIHIARNEGAVNAEFVSTQYLPAGAVGRIDAPAPGNCPF